MLLLLLIKEVVTTKKWRKAETLLKAANEDNVTASPGEAKAEAEDVVVVVAEDDVAVCG